MDRDQGRTGHWIEWAILVLGLAGIPAIWLLFAWGKSPIEAWRLMSSQATYTFTSRGAWAHQRGVVGRAAVVPPRAACGRCTTRSSGRAGLGRVYGSGEGDRRVRGASRRGAAQCAGRAPAGVQRPARAAAPLCAFLGNPVPEKCPVSASQRPGVLQAGDSRSAPRHAAGARVGGRGAGVGRLHPSLKDLWY